MSSACSEHAKEVASNCSYFQFPCQGLVCVYPACVACVACVACACYDAEGGVFMSVYQFIEAKSVS